MNLSQLNQQQLSAVTAPLGPVLVLAGAGSGKTRVLTYRIAYLIEQDLIKPEHILAVTFTNKAAKEMQSRVTALLQAESKTKLSSQPALGTFHSIGVRILRKYITHLGYSHGFVIIDTDDQLKVLKDILSDLGIPTQYKPTLFKAYISSAKNLLQTPAQFDLGLEGDLHQMVAQVYARYQNYLVKQNSVDFDDLLMLPIKLFENFPQVLRNYQDLWQYILVDEYQDTNQAQYMFLHLLAKNQNLFVVGDDAQSIYGFRGSNIANILNFEKDFKDALVIKLEQNYRSSQNILTAAQKVIELNTEQKPKTLWTNNGDGEKVVIKESFDGRAEAIFVAKKIIGLSSPEQESEELSYSEEEFAEPEYQEPSVNGGFSILDQFLKQNRRPSGLDAYSGYVPQLPKDHTSLAEFAVLYRTHSQSRQIEEIFIEAGIPYHIVGGVKFYDRKEVKDVIAFLRLISNPVDIVSLKRVINLPARGLGEKSVEKIRELILNLTQAVDLPRLQELILQLGYSAKQQAALQSFFGILQTASNIPEESKLSAVLEVILKLSKLEDFYRDGTEVGEARVENMRELFTVVQKFDHAPWQEGLAEFLEEVALVTDLDNLTDQRNSVTLMTLHAAKGLEFETVFFVGLEEGILPHTNSLMDPSQLAEEIRLAYVGLTRARKRLFLLYAQSRQMFGSFQANPPSRILQVLPNEVVNVDGNLAALYADDNLNYEPF
ncbi:MAG: UvrD-helicase domain-containing protein [Candidatus Doudnabacteria bacterium]